MQDSNSNQVPVWAHILCGWPLLLVAIGGAIGGGLGGLAYGVSISLFKTSLPMPLKIILPIGIGMLAVGLWVVIAVALGVFANR
ncbi:hypothetical protein GC197_17265 [bacterium]|nr:hypothetical protein [bacterium]